MQAIVPEYHKLVKQLPNNISEETKYNFMSYLNYELLNIIQIASTAKKPMIILNEPRQAGEQWILEFEVKDLNTPAKNEYNWHLQNTSQWLYAGCILIENDKVSTHH